MSDAPADLFEQVFHAIEEYEPIERTWYLAGGETRVEKVSVFVPELWIRRVHERKILTALHFLAIVYFVLNDFDEVRNERRLVRGWYDAMHTAVKEGALTARDVDSLLPLSSPPEELAWVMFLADADSFVKKMGMEWTCTEVVAHLFQELMSPTPPDSPASATGNVVQIRDEVAPTEEMREWDEQSLRKLLDESRQPGVTQTKLGSNYKVSRQRIGQLLAMAEEKTGVRKASPFAALGGRVKK
jgi:hypothetical protein